jgi:sugar/nucleoside kinase (ribokinase family)
VASRRAVAVGDVFVDYIGDLTDAKYKEALGNINTSTNVFASIKVKVGGAGVQFATAARAVGFKSSTLIGKIGGWLDARQKIVPDLPGSLVIDYLKQQDVCPLLAIDPASETGRILLVYLFNDRRLMLSDRLANALFSPVDISPEMKSAIRQADLVHVSGYTLLQDNRRAAVQELTHCAKEGQAKIALDIVPHDIYKSMSLDQLRAAMGGVVDWIFVEILTAHQLVELGQMEQVSTDLVNHVLESLTRTFPSVALFLNPSHAVVWDGAERLEYTTEYQPGVTSRGQSAGAQAELLYRRLNA